MYRPQPNRHRIQQSEYAQKHLNGYHGHHKMKTSPLALVLFSVA